MQFVTACTVPRQATSFSDAPVIGEARRVSGENYIVLYLLSVASK